MTPFRARTAALGLLLVIFTCFTWRGLTMFFSGDDMMNMYGAWVLDPWRLAQAQLLLWVPVYRPVGSAVYRVFYEVFGFHPLPLYILCWLLLAANVLVAYRFFRFVTAGAAVALTALSVSLVHGSFTDLYFSAGTIYDRLCFLFTTAGLIAYVQFRRNPKPRLFTAVCVSAVLAMSSKESGIALPPLLLCCECIYFLPAAWRGGTLRSSVRRLFPLFAVLAFLSLVFVFGRVHRTPELLNVEYRPVVSFSHWLTHLGEYFRILSYGHIHFGSVSTASILLFTAMIAILTRSREMAFGWLFFVLTVTPVTLITQRPGYVLYLPLLGIGLFCAGAFSLLARPLQRAVPQADAIVFVVVTAAVTWFHAHNWPPSPDPRHSPERRLTEQFRGRFPHLPAGSRLLFVSDEFPPQAFDLLFNLRLMYGDKSLQVNRLAAAADQRPDPNYSFPFDHIFAFESGRYVELENSNPAESVRLHILRDYPVEAQMDMGREDHSAYAVSGLRDEDSHEPSRWIQGHAKFKYRLCARPANFEMKFWVPDFVIDSGARILSIAVNGEKIGDIPLQNGMRQASLPVPINLISAQGYTFVEMDVDHPYKDAQGLDFGVVLLRAGFHFGDQPCQ